MGSNFLYDFLAGFGEAFEGGLRESREEQARYAPDDLAGLMENEAGTEG